MTAQSTQHHIEGYRGRFAPSPTGPLHFGSLVTAVGSYLQARSQGGEWLVRMEDLDPPREVPKAADDILRTLEAFHLHWDGPVIYQSQRHEAYEAALNKLTSKGHTFPCACSRKSIAKLVSSTSERTAGTSRIYPGTCRQGMPAGKKARMTRLRIVPRSVEFQDLIQGQVISQLDRDVGDFVVKRADGLYAYHLAVVVDDAEQNITEIVRGIDLIDSTPHHLYLQSLLGLYNPQYAHLPIVVNAQGEKLSKQTHAAPVETTQPGPTLVRALTFLGHPPDSDVINADPETLLSWALEKWDIERIPHNTKIYIT